MTSVTLILFFVVMIAGGLTCYFDATRLQTSTATVFNWQFYRFTLAGLIAGLVLALAYAIWWMWL